MIYYDSDVEKNEIWFRCREVQKWLEENGFGFLM